MYSLPALCPHQRDYAGMTYFNLIYNLSDLVVFIFNFVNSIKD